MDGLLGSIAKFIAFDYGEQKPTRARNHDEFGKLVARYGYDLSEIACVDLSRLWMLYEQRRLDVRRPVSSCRIQCVTVRGDFEWSPDGRTNLAMLDAMPRHPHCTSPEIFYFEVWHGGLTCAVIRKLYCLGNALSLVGYRPDDLRVIGAGVTFDSTVEARVASYHRCAPGSACSETHP